MAIATAPSISPEMLLQLATFLSPILKTDDLQPLITNGNLTSESFGILVERMNETLKRNELLAKHKSPIKQLPTSGRWYTRLGGRKVERTHKEDLENLIIAYYKEDTISLKTLYPEFMEHRKISVADTTWLKDVRYFNMYIANSDIADKPIKELILSDGERFVQHCLQIKPDMKYKYWVGVIGCVNQMLKYAMGNGYLEKNPFINLQVKKDLFTPATQTRDSDTIFSDEEKIKVCTLAQEDAKETRTSTPLGIILLFNLGLRNGELCALKWGDIEEYYSEKYIHIQREMVADVDETEKAHGFRILDHCKTPAGNRRIFLNKEAVETLQQIKAYNTAKNIPTGNDDYIFLRTEQSDILHCTTRSFDSRLRKYCEAADMEVIKSPHDIRRTVLTNLCRNGMPLPDIQRLAGHSSLKQTLAYIRTSSYISDAKEHIEELSYLKMVVNIGEHDSPIQKNTANP